MMAHAAPLLLVAALVALLTRNLIVALAPHSVGRGALAGAGRSGEACLGRAILQSGSAHRCRRRRRSRLALPQARHRFGGSDPKYPRRCGAVLGLSALTIGLTILAFKLVADGVGSFLSLGSWTVIVPPVTLVQLLPVSLAGWGVREMALVVMLASFGVPAEAALATSLLLGLCLIIDGLPGGLIWVADWDIPRPPPTPELSKSVLN
jgi:hypothetical protein